MNFKLLKHLAYGVLLAGFSFNASAAPAEDSYEVNNELATASDLTTDEGVTIPNLVSFDEDWYKIEVTPNFNRVQITLAFTHATEDLELDFYDSDGIPLDFSHGVADEEFVEYDVSPLGGIYYIKVSSFYGYYIGNTYSLLWNDVAPMGDDAYEPNDTYDAATNLDTRKDVWLSDYNGAAQAVDEDWYSMYVNDGTKHHVVVDAVFTHALADIDIVLYAPDGTTELASSKSLTDNENIAFTVDAQGVYLVKVFRYLDNGDANTPYDLRLKHIAAPIPGSDDGGSLGLISLLLLPLVAVLRRKIRA